MKRLPLLITAVFLVAVMLACDFAGINIDLGGGSEEPAKELKVEAGIAAPVSGASLPMLPVDIAYHASSTDGISAVELIVDEEIVDGFVSPTADQKVVALKYTWQPSSSGSHTIRVRAMSGSGDWSEYVSTTVTVEEQASQPAQQEQPAQPAQPEQPANTPEGVAPPPAPQATETPKDVTIFDIKHDADIFYYGTSNCGSKKVTITAQVTHPDKVYGLYVFTRFADYAGSGVTKWDSGTHFSKKSDGTYSITFESDTLANYSTYRDAIMNFQIVAQDKSGTIIARSEVNKKITLKGCN